VSPPPPVPAELDPWMLLDDHPGRISALRVSESSAKSAKKASTDEHITAAEGVIDAFVPYLALP
jgi:hypothetical protein